MEPGFKFARQPGTGSLFLLDTATRSKAFIQRQREPGSASNGRVLTILLPGALDLVGRGRRAPDETLGKRAVQEPALQRQKGRA